MASRMERYTVKQDQQVASRTLKNKKVYDDLYTNATITNFSSVEANVIDLSSVQEKGLSRREAYQKTRGAAGFGSGLEDTRELKEYPYEYEYSKKEEEPEVRDFDINRVLEEAKKNREDDDELERRRRLKTTEYNILTDLNEEKLKEYQNSKKEVLSLEEEENLKELFHTITSKTMSHDVNEILEREKTDRKRVSKNLEESDDFLLDDLMPTKIDETIITGDLAEQLEEYSDIRINVSESITKTVSESEDYGETVIDKSFYTKSMDLSKEDLVQDEDDRSFADDTKTSPWIKVIVTILVIALIVAIGFVIYQYLLK